jgi:hypothetical protein
MKDIYLLAIENAKHAGIPTHFLSALEQPDKNAQSIIEWTSGLRFKSDAVF